MIPPAASSATTVIPNETKDKSIAHGGDDFYADPGSPWVNAEHMRSMP